MSLLQEFEQINDELTEKYGKNIRRKINQYCENVIKENDQDTVANEYVLEADKERYFNNDKISKPLNSGHVYSGLMYDEKLWKKFFAWYDKNRIHRYSDEIPYSKRRFWYWTSHGTGPGTIPDDLMLLDEIEGENKKGTMGLYICLDGVLNTDELKWYDLKEESPYNE